MKKITTAQHQREILAKNLNELLKLKRKTQADVIRETGFAEATVRSWFNGEKYPRLDKIQALADYFNRIRQKSPILYRWVMNAVRYEGYRW